MPGGRNHTVLMDGGRSNQHDVGVKRRKRGESTRE